MTINEITGRVQYLQELRRMAEDIAGEIEGVQNEIKAHMEQHGLSELVAGPFRVSWTTVLTTRVDARALARDYPDLAARYTKSMESRRFTVR